MRIVSLAAAAGLLLAATTVNMAQNPNSGAGDPETRKNESMPGKSGTAPGQQMQQRGSAPGQPGASGYAPGQQGTTGQGTVNPDGKMGSQREPKSNAK
jgi:hypothetical protein